jgi:hypothetical protein
MNTSRWAAYQGHRLSLPPFRSAPLPVGLLAHPRAIPPENRSHNHISTSSALGPFFADKCPVVAVLIFLTQTSKCLPATPFVRCYSRVYSTEQESEAKLLLSKDLLVLYLPASASPLPLPLPCLCLSTSTAASAPNGTTNRLPKNERSTSLAGRLQASDLSERQNRRANKEQRHG